MKKLQNNFTTPEQSKRLLELGVPADSADCYLLRTRNEKYDFIVAVLHETLYSKREKFNMLEYLPCWSVGRLNEIFKICSDGCIEIYDLDLEGTQIERAMQAFEGYSEYNWLYFSRLDDCA